MAASVATAEISDTPRLWLGLTSMVSLLESWNKLQTRRMVRPANHNPAVMTTPAANQIISCFHA
jgi:hypothetical protein